MNATSAIAKYFQNCVHIFSCFFLLDAALTNVFKKKTKLSFLIADVFCDRKLSILNSFSTKLKFQEKYSAFLLIFHVELKNESTAKDHVRRNV